MSKEHPIISMTGSAGAGTSTLRRVLEKLFYRKHINVTYVMGDSFRRHDFETWDQVFHEYQKKGIDISHFGPEANEFDKIESLFREYGKSGTGKIRQYLKNEELAKKYDLPQGKFSDYSEIPSESEVLFYDGFHGGLVTDKWSRRELSDSHNPEVIKIREDFDNVEHQDIDVAQHVDLLVGVVPSMNLEWIQKIQRDISATGIGSEAVSEAILRRMPDYINYIIPQFSVSDINFQRVPLVDTSNPFDARNIPTLDESMMVARFRQPEKHDFRYLLSKIDGSFMSRPNTLVIPGSEFEYAIMAIFEPILDEMFEEKEES